KTSSGRGPARPDSVVQGCRSRFSHVRLLVGVAVPVYSTRMRSVQMIRAGRIVPHDLALALCGNWLPLDVLQAGLPGAIRVRVVGISNEVAVPQQRYRGGQSRLVGAAGDIEVAFEVFGWRLLHLRSFSRAAVMPVLFHPLDPVRCPACVSLDMH